MTNEIKVASVMVTEAKKKRAAVEQARNLYRKKDMSSNHREKVKDRFRS